jgi:transcriptional regulator with XRE-family HTH domain
MSEPKRKRGRPKLPVLYCRQKLSILRRLELRLTASKMSEDLGWSRYEVSRIEGGTVNFTCSKAEQIEDKYGLKKGFFALPLAHVLAEERGELTPEADYPPFKDEADRHGGQWRQVDLDQLSVSLMKGGRVLLDEREKHILRERRLLRKVKYRSLDKPATLLELSQLYGISRERVRQIEARAFKKLLALVQPGRPQVQIGHMQEQRKPKWWRR